MSHADGQAFWEWFVRHEALLHDFDPEHEFEREGIFDELERELHKVDARLAFEFGPKAPTREFVISADGVKQAFPAVVSLVKMAPPLYRWKVTAFRPRRDLNIVQISSRSVDPEAVEVALLDNGRMVGIHLFLSGFREEDNDLKKIGYLLLGDALGEYDLGTHVGLLRMLPTDAETNNRRYPLSELPQLFDQLVSQLRSRQGRGGLKPC